MRFMAEEMTTVGLGIVMAVILVFLLLGGLIVSFFGDLIFTVAAFALLAALLIGRLAWIQSAWVSVTNQPITGIVQPGYPLTIYMGLSTCILFSLKSLLTQSPPNHTRVGQHQCKRKLHRACPQKRRKLLLPTLMPWSLSCFSAAARFKRSSKRVSARRRSSRSASAMNPRRGMHLKPAESTCSSRMPLYTRRIAPPPCAICAAGKEYRSSR
jgi:hypothetical protein